MNKLSIILIALNNDDISDTLDDIFKQNYANLEVFIITSKKYFNISKYNKYKCCVLEVNDTDSVFNKLISLSTSLSGDFITFMNSLDINAPKRFEKQILFMNSNNVNICSCLEMPIDDDTCKNEALSESNNFVTSDDINFVISASYLPLDLYTFVFRKNFLNKILHYSSYYFFTSEIDLILYFLRFENISKVPEILYYVKKSRIPYDECLNYYLGPDTKNKLALFNKNNILNSQYYFNEILCSKRKYQKYKKDYKYTIITILGSCNIGGTESYVINLANKLREENINLCILTNECFNKELFIFYNIELHVLNLNNKNEFINTISSINNIKLFQIHMNDDIYLCPVIKSIMDVPIILTIHGIYYSEKILNNFLSYIDKIIFVSDYAKKYYNNLINKLPFDKYTAIPNGIENPIKNLKQKDILRKSLGIPKDSIIILYCSRLSYNKSNLARLFLESFKKVKSKNKEILAVIIGDGNYSKFVKDLAYKINSELGQNRIFILGNRFNIFDYYNDSDLIIGTGRVALEAMSLGKPVISFGLNGYVNIINNTTILEMIHSNFGDHCSSSPNLNDELIINELSTFINSLIDSNKKLKELGIWNKSYVKKYLSLDKIATFYINACENENSNE
ncbi:MAG: glycosyltransferase [Clostridium perfringens]|nr:glycosyltransferase [Clostridium perfringens]